MNLTSGVYKNDIQLVCSLCINLANKANECKPKDTSNEMPIVLAVKYTLCMMTNMLQSQGLNLEIGVKTRVKAFKCFKFPSFSISCKSVNHRFSHNSRMLQSNAYL